MSTRTKPNDEPVEPERFAAEDQPEPGYEDWLAAELEAGCAELDAGLGIPADEVWKKLGLERGSWSRRAASVGCAKSKATSPSTMSPPQPGS